MAQDEKIQKLIEIVKYQTELISQIADGLSDHNLGAPHYMDIHKLERMAKELGEVPKIYEYEVDVGYNQHLLEWLKQFHVRISMDATSITIKVPFSSPSDAQYAKNLLDASLSQQSK